MTCGLKCVPLAVRKLRDDEIKSRLIGPEEIKLRRRFPITVVLENIRSMHNVGAAFRTSDAACIEELVLCGYTAKPPRKEIEKTALGATESVPWRHFATSTEAVQYLKSKGIPIMALEHCDASRDLLTMECPFPVAIAVGNEVDGLSDEMVAAADLACEIPMYGRKQSLNAAVAYGIAVYQLIYKFRQQT